MKRTLLCILTLIIFLPFISEARPRKSGTGIVAHRGFWNCEEAGYAKNSVAALRCAQEAGLWGSEFDVNMTADSVLIIYHDSSIDGKRIEKNPYSAFKEFKLANGEPIPTIDDYLKQAQKYPETMLVYEFKGHSSPEAEDLLMDLTITKLQEYGMLDPERVMFISFSFHICSSLAERLPGFTIQFLGSSKNPDELDEAGINGVDYNHAVYGIHKKWYKMARKNHMSVNAWTVDNKNEITRMLEMGVDQITTDRPLDVREVMQQTGHLELR